VKTHLSSLTLVSFCTKCCFGVESDVFFLLLLFLSVFAQELKYSEDHFFLGIRDGRLQADRKYKLLFCILNEQFIAGTICLDPPSVCFYRLIVFNDKQ